MVKCAVAGFILDSSFVTSLSRAKVRPKSMKGDNT